MALNVIPTHPDANSYVTVAEADSYLSAKIEFDIWDAETDSSKEEFLKLACSQMEGFRFFGEKMIDDEMYYRAEQGLSFPRNDEESLTAQVLSVNGLTFTTSYNQNSSSEYANKYLTIIVYEGSGKGNTIALSSFVNGVGTVASWGGVTLNSTSQLLLLEKDIIPNEIKYAQIEQALFLCLLKSKEIDLSGEYDQAKIEDKQGRPFSPNAKQYLQGYISRLGRITL